jgi:hypothetical protein
MRSSHGAGLSNNFYRINGIRYEQNAGLSNKFYRINGIRYEHKCGACSISKASKGFQEVLKDPDSNDLRKVRQLPYDER